MPSQVCLFGHALVRPEAVGVAEPQRIIKICLNFSVAKHYAL